MQERLSKSKQKYKSKIRCFVNGFFEKIVLYSTYSQDISISKNLNDNEIEENREAHDYEINKRRNQRT